MRDTYTKGRSRSTLLRTQRSSLTISLRGIEAQAPKRPWRPREFESLGHQVCYRSGACAPDVGASTTRKTMTISPQPTHLTTEGYCSGKPDHLCLLISAPQGLRLLSSRFSTYTSVQFFETTSQSLQPGARDVRLLRGRHHGDRRRDRDTQFDVRRGQRAHRRDRDTACARFSAAPRLWIGDDRSCLRLRCAPHGCRSPRRCAANERT